MIAREMTICAGYACVILSSIMTKNCQDINNSEGYYGRFGSLVEGSSGNVKFHISMHRYICLLFPSIFLELFAELTETTSRNSHAIYSLIVLGMRYLVGFAKYLPKARVSS